MTVQRLNHCMLLHIHRDKTDGLNLKDIASEFIHTMKQKFVILDNPQISIFLASPSYSTAELKPCYTTVPELLYFLEKVYGR